MDLLRKSILSLGIRTTPVILRRRNFKYGIGVSSQLQTPVHLDVGSAHRRTRNRLCLGRGEQCREATELNNVQEYNVTPTSSSIAIGFPMHPYFNRELRFVTAIDLSGRARLACYTAHNCKEER